MVKANDFWNYLCVEQDYRFFSGVACPGLLPLYKKMSSKFMHYVPAANERIALALVSGAYTAGMKGGLLLDMKFAYDITSLSHLNIDYRIPLLVIGYNGTDSESYLAFDFPTAFIMTEDFVDDVDRVIKKSTKDEVPGLIVFEKGAL